MPYINFDLPEYPCKSDMWDNLKNERRPIVIYGMGNGADKLFRRFEKYGIEVADIFASDGFVRGHTFHGMRVKSFSEIKEEYSDFVIILSFASSRPEVIEMLADIDKNYEMLVPDMPVADEQEYFDREFYNSNYEKIKGAYELFEDEKSRAVYASVINYRLSGKLSYLLSTYTEKNEMYSILPCDKINTVIDAGAYNGDTAREALEYFSNVKKIYAIEPDRRNYKKLTKYSESAEIDIECINSAVWSECRVGSFLDSGNRNSSVSSTASYQHKENEVSLISIDSLNILPDYVKYDVEGAEYEALLGTLDTIRRAKPAMLISLYHRSRDIFTLPLFVAELNLGYKLSLTRLRCIPSWEINLIATQN